MSRAANNQSVPRIGDCIERNGQRYVVLGPSQGSDSLMDLRDRSGHRYAMYVSDIQRFRITTRVAADAVRAA